MSFPVIVKLLFACGYFLWAIYLAYKSTKSYGLKGWVPFHQSELELIPPHEATKENRFYIKLVALLLLIISILTTFIPVPTS